MPSLWLLLSPSFLTFHFSLPLPLPSLHLCHCCHVCCIRRRNFCCHCPLLFCPPTNCRLFAIIVCCSYLLTFPSLYPLGSLGCNKLEPYPFFMMVTCLPCIAHKLVLLKTSTMKYFAASWRARIAVLCICRWLFPNFSTIWHTRRWKGFFLLGDLYFFGTFGSPLEPPFLGANGEAFSWQSPFVQPLVQTLWLNESVGLLPQ